MNPSAALQTHGSNLEFTVTAPVCAAMEGGGVHVGSMLAEIPAGVWEQVASAGLPALLMSCAVWWLQKGNRELVMELNKERSERIDVLENHVVACDQDRRELRDMLLTHLGAAAKFPKVG